jgi:hypothetical protein
VGKAALPRASLEGREMNAVLKFQGKKRSGEFFPIQFYLWFLYTPWQHGLIIWALNLLVEVPSAEHLHGTRPYFR